jgi:hypothetical protein
VGLPVDLLISKAHLIPQRGLVRTEIAIDNGKIEKVGKRESGHSYTKGIRSTSFPRMVARSPSLLVLVIIGARLR